MKHSELQKITAEEFIKHIENAHRKGVPAQLKHYQISGRVSFPSQLTWGAIIVDQCEFEEELNIEETNFSSVFFRNLILKQGFVIKNSFFDSLHLDFESFSGGFNVKGCAIRNLYIDKLHIKSALFRNNRVHYTKIENAQIENLTINGKESFYYFMHFNLEKSNGNFLIQNIVLNEISILKTVNENCNVSLKNTTLHTIQITNTENKGVISFTDIKINPVKVKIENSLQDNFMSGLVPGYSYPNDVVMEGKTFKEIPQIKLVKFEPEIGSTVKLIKSQLGKLEFNNLDFSLFSGVEIKEASLKTVIFNDCELELQNLIGNTASKYAVFNELLSIAKENHNRLNYIKYYRSSQKILMKGFIKKGWKKNIPSLIIVGTSWFFSDFGVNWIRSIIVTFILGALIYSTMILSSSQIEFSVYNPNWTLTKFYFNGFFTFIDPTHKVTFVDTNNITLSNNSIFVILNLLGRVLISVGLFETIIAFRKFIRR